MINKSAIKPVSFPMRPRYPSDSARPSFMKLVPSSRHPLPPVDQTYAEARKTDAPFTQVASRDGRVYLLRTYMYIRHVRACSRGRAMRDRPVHRLEIAGATPTHLENWAKCTIINNPR